MHVNDEFCICKKIIIVDARFVLAASALKTAV